MTSKIQRIALGCVAISLTSGFTTAWAQDATREDEIVVTAQRRAESIQEVPLSITALGAEEIERSGIAEFADYGARVPNLSFSASGGNATDNALSIAIRGVYGANTTGFYIDDSPLIGALDPRVVDVERIEALRGPQGTLYGARSMGGTVRLITVQPDLDDFSGRAHAIGSSTEDGGLNYGLDGALNIPVVPGVFGVRAVAYHQEDAGFLDIAPRSDAPTPFAVRENVDSETANGLQVSGLASFLGGRLRIAPRLMYEKVERGGRRQADFSEQNRTNLRQFDLPETSSSEWNLATLTGSYDTSLGVFLSASSWFHRDYSDSEDSSEWTTAVLGFQGASLFRANTEQDIFSQELRFVSDWDGPISLTAGLFYQNSEASWIYPIGQNAIDGFSVDAFHLNSPTSVSERAAFAELTWDVTDSLRFILGARAFENEFEFALTQGGDLIGGDETFAGVQNENDVTPKVGIQYDLDDERMIYATMSEGFRIGGVNYYSNALCGAEIASLSLGDISTFESDSLRSYELGLKSRWLDRRLTVNADVFQIDWSDVQQRVGLACGYFLDVNAGEAQIRGAEFEANIIISDKTEVQVGVGYTDSEITDTGGLTTITEGQRIQNVPTLTWSVALDHEFQLAALPAFFHLDYAFTGSSFSANTDPVVPLKRPSYALLNLRFGVEAGAGQFTLFARNLLDESANYADISALGIQTPGRPRIIVNQPRTLGLEWRREF